MRQTFTEQIDKRAAADALSSQTNNLAYFERKPGAMTQFQTPSQHHTSFARHLTVGYQNRRVRGGQECAGLVNGLAWASHQWSCLRSCSLSNALSRWNSMDRRSAVDANTGSIRLVSVVVRLACQS